MDLMQLLKVSYKNNWNEKEKMIKISFYIKLIKTVLSLNFYLQMKLNHYLT